MTYGNAILLGNDTAESTIESLRRNAKRCGVNDPRFYTGKTRDGLMRCVMWVSDGPPPWMGDAVEISGG